MTVSLSCADYTWPALGHRTVLAVIADLGFTGYVGQEFVPKRDPLTSLRQAFEICDV